MPFHWQSNVNVQNVGVEDMVLLRNLNDDSIVENLRKRLAHKAIFTYIGPVLISVNPFQEMPYFTEKEIELYQSAAQYENPPHIYSLADFMYRNMMIDNERQCVIISGESGAGKTVCAKYIMNYIARISGGGKKVEHVKEVIIKSNPLLESFGNAATLRNWNSSRFGKYVEIIFGKGGEPVGGLISNFLLEKSRVVSLGKGERNFHIFYQLLAGADQHTRENLGISKVDYYIYLNQSECYLADGTDDAIEYSETLNAMQVIGISDYNQLQILQIVSAILHIGNILFVEENNYASVMNDDYLQYPAYLLGLTPEAIKEKILTRKLESKWGREKEEIDVKLNVEQAVYTRDAWAKAMYSKLFDYLVCAVNKSLNSTNTSNAKNLSIGILDIYGFEIFDNNGFEQFCINFVNEKLQQIFIELTLKAEQQEYVSEGIKWTPVDYFNNKIVCDLIESKKPPGIMCLLDDICSQIHGQSDGVDSKFLVKLNQQVGQNPHFKNGTECFIISHYAGEVVYQIDGFCDKNRDVLYPDLIQLMQSSTIPFMKELFPIVKEVGNNGKSKPTSASSKIRVSYNRLVDSLMQCTPYYIRCIKPNENKRALEFNAQRVLNQVQYLGLKENIRVRRAGYTYRRPFEKFLWRYAILSAETWPKYNGDPKKACHIICEASSMSSDQFQLGTTKIFIKNPESLFLLEEARERKYDGYARILQKAFRKYTADKYYVKQKEEASDLFYGKKERRRNSLNRNFVGDYIGIENHPALQAIVRRRERIDFAHTVNKYDRKFQPKKVDLLLTAKGLILVGKELVKKGINKGKFEEVVKRKIDMEKIDKIGLSPFQDDFFVLYIHEEYSSLLETPLKTEFLSGLSKRYKEQTNKTLNLIFNTSHTILLKKTRFTIGNPGSRLIQFSLENDAQFSQNACLKSNGKTLIISVTKGLPNNTRPFVNRIPSDSNKLHFTKFSNNNNIASQRPSQFIMSKFTSEMRNSEFSITKQQQTHLNYKNNTVHPVQNLPLNQTSQPLSRPRLAPKPKGVIKSQNPIVKSLYAYEAQDTDELSFIKDQIIELLQKDNSGWWQGRIGSKTGLFPANYIQEL